MAWTSEHEWLMQEYVALVTEPAWYDQPTITARLTVIRNELADAGDTLDPEESINELISEFENARQESDESIEHRYLQLIDEACGTVDSTLVMSYPQIAKHMKDTYWTPLTTEHTTLQTDQLSRDEDVSDGWESIWTELQSRFTELGEQADEDTTDTPIAQHMVKSHWNVLANDFETLQSEQEDRDEETADQWTAIWTELQSRFNELNDQAEDDINDAYDNRISALSQSMIDRGVYNSSLLDSHKAGIETQRANELRRLEESVSRQEIESYASITAQRVQQLGVQAANQMQLKLGELDLRTRAAQELQQLFVGNLQSRLAISQAEHQTYVQTMSQRMQSLSAKAANQMQLKLQEVAHRSQAAMELQKIFAATLDAVQARTDIAPSLSDVANLTMQLGRASTSTFPLLGMEASTFYAQQKIGAE